MFSLPPFAGWRGGAGGGEGRGSLFFGALKAGERGKANCSLAPCSAALKNVALSRQGKGLMQFKKDRLPHSSDPYVPIQIWFPLRGSTTGALQPGLAVLLTRGPRLPIPTPAPAPLGVGGAVNRAGAGWGHRPVTRCPAGAPPRVCSWVVALRGAGKKLKT